MDLLAFKVVIEPDEDVWRSYYPAWEHLGAATFGNTPEEAAANIKEVLEMIVGEIEEGMIEWPIEPCASDWEFSQPSIQSEPELVQLNCNHEHPGAVAEHGGLPVAYSESGSVNGDVYRLIYVAMDDVMAEMYARHTWLANRTGGYIPTVFVPPPKHAPVNGAEEAYGYISQRTAHPSQA